MASFLLSARSHEASRPRELQEVGRRRRRGRTEEEKKLLRSHTRSERRRKEIGKHLQKDQRKKKKISVCLLSPFLSLSLSLGRRSVLPIHQRDRIDGPDRSY